jgi:hypothetical protein
MNAYFRKILFTRVRKALLDARDASDLNHPYLIGKLREIVLNDLISPLLNTRYAIASGKITDYMGNLSGEIDLCIYSTLLHPPILFSSKNDIGIVPIESVLACIEVKSRLTEASLKDAYLRFKGIEQKLIMTPGIHDRFEMPLPQIYQKPKYAFFAFDKNFKKYSPATILDFYKDVDPNWNTDPLIQSICLVNYGWLCHTIKGWFHMPYDKRSKSNEEIIGFLCTLIQDIPKVEYSRGVPRIGYYLTDPSTARRFKDGQLVRKSWSNKGKIIFSDTRTDLN